VFSRFWLAAGSVGFGRSVSVGPRPSPDRFAVPSTWTISVQPAGSLRSNNAGALAEDEKAARTLSTGNGEHGAVAPTGAAPSLAFRLDL
jgi:hypothetical protein